MKTTCKHCGCTTGRYTLHPDKPDDVCIMCHENPENDARPLNALLGDVMAARVSDECFVDIGDPEVMRELGRRVAS